MIVIVTIDLTVAIRVISKTIEGLTKRVFFALI